MRAAIDAMGAIVDTANLAVTSIGGFLCLAWLVLSLADLAAQLVWRLFKGRRVP